MVFKIEANKVAIVRYADTGENVDPQYYEDFNTIESMFSFVEQALEKIQQVCLLLTMTNMVT